MNIDGSEFGSDGSIYPYYGYSVDVQVSWRFSNNSVIGSRIYDYDSPSDYSCSYKCSKGTSTVGAYIMFDF